MADMERENQCIGRIALEGLHNTRDLGGFETLDGRRILPKRLIRSGALFGATAGDLKILKDGCNLGTIVDFRTAAERRQKPDPEIDGVANLFNPILAEETVGITFEKKEGGEEKDTMTSVLEHASSLGGNPRNYIDKLYENLIVDEHASEYYRRFFDILLEADERAVLWHCSAGKDRVGVGTALLLTALGVDRDTVIRDFVKTNDYVMAGVEAVAADVEAKTHNRELAECAKVLLTVSEEYIRHSFLAMERECGSAENYLNERIGLVPEKTEALRHKFLAR